MLPSYADMVQCLHTHTSQPSLLAAPLLSEMRFRNPTKTDKTYSEIIQYFYRGKTLCGQPFFENFPGMYVHDSHDFCGGNKC